MKILIVEDEDDLRWALKELLEANGHEVIEAEDGRQGLERVALRPDFIFCDVNMPVLDGRGMLAEIRKMPGISDIPFVFVSARSKREEQREGMALGADDYITKPYNQADILAAIAARTARQRGLRDRIETLSQRQRREINAQWSHELLTPLNAVLGSLDLIESEADTISRTELKELLGLIREGATRQERLARKLIHFFSLEQMAGDASRAAAASCPASSTITRAANAAAQRQGRMRDLDLSVEAGEIEIGEELLATAMDEIVDNAAKFSRPGTPIVVRGSGSPGDYRIVVTDQGAGMSQEDMNKVGAFSQFDRKKHEQQGLGLGLAIVRLTARVAGGEFALGRGPEGKGLRVELALPVSPTTL